MPAPQVTERWSDYAYTSGDSATRVFDVAYVTDAEQALGAVSLQKSVYPNVGHPLDGLLRCKFPMKVTRPGFNLMRVQADYAYGPQPQNKDRTQDPPQFQWVFDSVTEPIDRDVDGNLIRNSASDMFNPPPTRHRRIRGIVVYRNELRFPIGTVNNYENHYNSDHFSLFGLTVEPGQAFVKGITQIKPEYFTADFVRVQYHLAFAPGFARDKDGVWDGFALRLVDKGRNSWCSIDGSAELRAIKVRTDDGRYALTSYDVPLDGKGEIYDAASFYNLDATNPATAMPNPKPPKNFTATTPDDGYGVVLAFKNYKTATFGSLGLFPP